ncbi:hypothetical protein L486_04717 [Kwoniella mangroviensis CBS 10435]|uniref:Uncharacterized protein n=1 Tax=Kwoniella mangroviensis CBS 10435 TaxID=1331196 RepID=A0A1B9IP79_9TREE|nr:hypothetical protein L486_04717 [Kwoniella mangroviensis CBS 10435]
MNPDTWENSTLTGWRFLKETLQPSEAYYNGDLHKNAACSYLKVAHQRIPIYFTEFYVHGRAYSRLDLCKAWSYGLNGSHFHHCLVHSLRQKILKDPTWGVEIDRLMIAQREWNGSFVELNLTLTILYECERIQFVPAEWKSPGLFNKHDLQLSPNRTNRRTPPQQLTSLFLIATEQLLNLEYEVGYAKEFGDMAERFNKQDNLIIPAYDFPGVNGKQSEHAVDHAQVKSESTSAQEGRTTSQFDQHLEYKNREERPDSNMTALIAANGALDGSAGGGDDADSYSIASSSTPLLTRSAA